MGSHSGLEMPFLEHLEELRTRLIWSVGALILGVVIAFVLVLQVDVIGWIEYPIAPLLEDGKLVYTNPADPFRIVMSVSFAFGLIIASPVLVYQLWAFVSPALYQHEKRVVIPVLVGAAALFLGGVLLAFFFVLPVTLNFLVGFQSPSLQPMITAREYFGFAMGMCLAFGAVFELPIVILGLTALGIVTPVTLARFRRYALVLAIVVAALITPGGDPTSLFLMTAPIYLLYEVSIALSVLVHRRRERRERLAAEREGYGAAA